MQPVRDFILDRLKAIKFAVRGFWILIRTEKSIIIQVIIGIIMTIVGVMVDISATEWLFQIVAIGMLLVAESLNTAIEKIADFVHPDYHKKIEQIKDVSAGAAFFAAIFAIIIGLIIYIPKFM